MPSWSLILLFSCLSLGLATPSVAAESDILVTTITGQSLRIQNHRVTLTVTTDRILKIEIAQAKLPPVSTRRKLTESEYNTLTKKLAEIDWEKVASDDVIGLDGSGYNIQFSEHRASLWSPTYDTRKRGLTTLLRFMEYLNHLAGLDRHSLPK